MRLLLDAHISGRVIGRHLRQAGHYVLALDEHRELEGVDDSEILKLAADDERIVVTHDVKDFPRILRDWADEGLEHAGCIIIVGISLNEFGELIRAVEAGLGAAGTPTDWVNRSLFVGLSGGPYRVGRGA